MAKVFFSYSHKDEELRDRLETHLALLKRQGIIETWHDRRIEAGQDFSNEIDAELEAADVILLLVSADFISSNYCFEAEMMRALDRHEKGEARVIPVILRHCDWKSAPFGKLQAAPKDAKPIMSWPDIDEALTDVARMLRLSLINDGGPTKRPTVPRQVGVHLKRRLFVQATSVMARYFEGSLEELKKRNTGVETVFRRLDANHCTAVAYVLGKAEARCQISLGSGIGRGGISFSYNDHAVSGSFNENLPVQSDEQSLFLHPLGMASMRGEVARKLTHEGASEYYWSLFIRGMQP